MELTLPICASNLLVLLFNSLYWDMKSFLASISYFVKTIPNFFSTKWGFVWGKVQTSRSACDEQESCPQDETFVGERKIGIEEVNCIMNRLGLMDQLEDYGNINSVFGEEDFSKLFDVEEPSFGEIMETFEVFDVNKDGFIDASELQRVVCNLGLKKGCCLEDCKRMIKAFDGNGDGLIDFQDFVKLMEVCLF